MPLLNYTTTVDVAKTSGQIEGLLIKAGARQIVGEFDEDGYKTALGFGIETPHGPRRYHLPVNAVPVQTVLIQDRVQPRYRTYEHAERVAWRILKDWLEAQLAIIATGMVTLDQVMLPYMQGDDGRTVYELYLDQQLLALEAGEK